LSVGTGHGIQITLAGTYSFQEIHLLDMQLTVLPVMRRFFNNSGGQVTLNVTGGTILHLEMV
jgi:hypothetical protein